MTDNPQTQIAVATPEQVEQWQNHIGLTLEDIYNAAPDEQTKALVDQAWTKTQELAQLAQANGIAGQAAIEQRDAALTELNDLLQAIDKADEFHPKLEGLVEWLREEEQAYAYEIMDDHMYETVDEALYDIIKSDPLLAEHKAWQVAHKLVDAITGCKVLDEQQKEALISFLQSLV